MTDLSELIERVKEDLRHVLAAPHPEKMPGTHLTDDMRAQLAFAQIDASRSRLAALLLALESQS